MSRIARWTQKIFGSGASDIGIVGSGADGTKIISTDLAQIQSKSAWGLGWLAAVLGSSKFPPIEEMNALDYLTTTQLAYLFQEGIPAYDAGTTYFTNSIVKKPGTYQIYGSLTDSNTGNPLTDTGNWELLQDLSTGGGGGGSIPSRTAVFTTSGTWTAPAGVTQILVDAVAGGGGGAGSNGSSNGGSGGGGGDGVIGQVLTVVPATVYTITIGAAGALGALSANGGAGGNTSIGTLLVLNGGGGGNSSGVSGGSGTGTAGLGGDANLNFGGAGGGSLFGQGANVRQGVGAAGSGYGTGGSGGTVISGSGTQGGAGKAGFVLIQW